MCIRCISDVYQMCIRCTADVYQMCIKCASDMYQMCIRSVLDVHQLCIRCASVVHQMCIRCASDVYQICTRCAPDVHRMCIRWSQPQKVVLLSHDTKSDSNRWFTAYSQTFLVKRGEETVRNLCIPTSVLSENTRKCLEPKENLEVVPQVPEALTDHGLDTPKNQDMICYISFGSSRAFERWYLIGGLPLKGIMVSWALFFFLTPSTVMWIWVTPARMHFFLITNQCNKASWSCPGTTKSLSQNKPLSL